VGFFAATIRTDQRYKDRDTVTDDTRPAAAQLPGFEDIKPMVFAGRYTVDSLSTRCCATPLEKLRLNDSSFLFEPESSGRTGLWLPLRLSRPAAHGDHPRAAGARVRTGPDHHRARLRYHITLTDGSVMEVDNPSRWPDPTNIESIREPVITAKILTMKNMSAAFFKLVEEKRGKQLNFEYVTGTRVLLTYELPLNEIVLDFYDRLKSISRGYASLDYQLAASGSSPMVKLDILVSGEPVDALSIIVHKDFAYERGRRLVSKMRELIPGSSLRLQFRPR